MGTCLYCNIKFDNEQGKQYHEANLHSNQRLKCTLCDALFKWGNNFTTHNESEHNCEAQCLTISVKGNQTNATSHARFQCPFCTKNFKKKKHQVQHMDFVHFKKRIRCLECSFLTYKEFSFNSHNATNHMGKSTSDRVFLNDLVLTLYGNENERRPRTHFKFMCIYCQMIFTCPKTFSTHKRSCSKELLESSNSDKYPELNDEVETNSKLEHTYIPKKVCINLIRIDEREDYYELLSGKESQSIQPISEESFCMEEMDKSDESMEEDFTMEELLNNIEKINSDLSLIAKLDSKTLKSIPLELFNELMQNIEKQNDLQHLMIKKIFQL